MENREKQTLNRTGAICASLGAVVTGVSWGIHPELTDPAGYLPLVAGSSDFAASTGASSSGWC